ncbi:serum response factor-binding protein 1 [Plakobranchus ocellatus]|uniref:Serum response factor-binding protein 1 n=1 Tax=Plakobranchus ocellatus TaxID=259542 RepID=A0AAV3Z6M0_9GAST|nr:serum response factor-binding protein 1 [Plakobranchus ocellatus]
MTWFNIPVVGDSIVVDVPNVERAVVDVLDGESVVDDVPDGESTVVDVPDGESAVVDVPNVERAVVDVPDVERAVVDVPDGESTVIDVPDGENAVVDVPDIGSAVVDVPDGENAFVTLKFEPVRTKGLPKGQGRNGTFAEKRNLATDTVVGGSAFVDSCVLCGVCGDMEAAREFCVNGMIEWVDYELQDKGPCYESLTFYGVPKYVETSRGRQRKKNHSLNKFATTKEGTITANEKDREQGRMESHDRRCLQDQTRHLEKKEDTFSKGNF